MPLYWGDYLRDTMHLSAAEHGAYFMLIGHYWTTGKPLPADDATLIRVSRMTPAEWKHSKPTIKALFIVQADGWHHKRVDAELERANRIANAKQNAGKLGGKMSAEARAEGQAKGKQTGKQNPTPSPSPSPSPRQQQQAPSSLPREPEPAAAARGAPLGEKPQESPENRLIAAFDAACRIAWPEAHRAFPAATDGVIAARLVEAGADEKLVADVANSVLRRRAAKGKTCPSALGFLEAAVLDALADRKAGKSRPVNGADTGGYTGPSLSPEMREHLTKTDPDYLADLDRRQGRAP